MLVQYPAIKPYATHHLTVALNHELYIEEVGVPHGIPVLILHDGPGGHTTGHDRRFFDPEKYRMILFDQRGCGRSIPSANLKDNTTQDLLNDIELIRQHLHIDKWVLAGGGWGSTLALLYAQQYGQHVNGLLLWSIFLARQQDIQWLYQEGTRHTFPEEWDAFIKPLRGSNLNNVIQGYYDLLTGDDDLQRRAADKAWATWEARCSSLEPQQKLVDEYTDPFYAKNLAKIKSHYLRHQFFIEDNQILQQVHKIARIPAILLHGRYNMLYRLSGAWDLGRQWNSATVKIIRDAGHSTTDPALIDAIIHSSKEMKKLYS